MAKVWEALSSLLHRLFRPCPCPPRSAGSLPGPGPSPTRPTGDPQLSRTKLVLPLNLQTTLLQEALGWGGGILHLLQEYEVVLYSRTFVDLLFVPVRKESLSDPPCLGRPHGPRALLVSNMDSGPLAV